MGSPPRTKQRTLGEEIEHAPAHREEDHDLPTILEWHRLKPLARVSLIRTGPGREPAD
jgi:hypothetical protein